MPRRGENIYKRKDGRWEGRYIKKYIDGKAKYGSVYARTYKEVKEKLNHTSEFFTNEICCGQRKYNSLTFQEIANEWLASVKNQLKESSLVKYHGILNNYLLPKFKDLKMESITQDDIADYFSELTQKKGKSGKELSVKTITGIFSVLKGIFEYAKHYKKLNVTDIKKLTFKQSQKALRILSTFEQEKLSKYLLQNINSINLGILLCLYTGIRLGEVCALKWEDISFDEQYVSINKTMQRIKNLDSADAKTYISISKPKSDCSIRKIPIPDELFRILQIFRKTDDAYVLSGHPQIFIEPRTMQNRFQTIIRKCDIEHANFHALRHTFATRCVELGFDYKSLSEILGHATVNITLNRYVHPSMELKQKNMNMLSNIITVK